MKNVMTTDHICIIFLMTAINSEIFSNVVGTPSVQIASTRSQERLGKTIKNLSQDTRSPGQVLNPGPPEYATGVLTIQP